MIPSVLKHVELIAAQISIWQRRDMVTTEKVISGRNHAIDRSCIACRAAGGAQMSSQGAASAGGGAGGRAGGEEECRN